ncbi:hypothetical protein ACP4OV_019442 [Aristida adscensionis]
MFGGVTSELGNPWWFPPLRRRHGDAASSIEDEVTQHNNKHPATGLRLRFTDLPLDILYRIFSKLPAKEIARSSVLSSEWRRCMGMWSACPRLTFDAVAICKCERRELSETTQVARFIPHVNGVLQKHRGSFGVVETLEFRTDFVGGLLAHHIHIWVEFAVSSRTKNLSLDLKPETWWEPDVCGRPRKQDLYVFPFQQLSALVSDTNWGSSLQQLHLSFVSFRPPSQFKGFPNLRKLHLEVLHIAREDLEHLLSHCASKIQWLRINRCVVDDQLTLATPLPNLLYLNVEYGLVTNIDINAANLATFEYEGDLVPIRLVHSLNLQGANICFSGAVFEHALISLVNGIPSVQSLSFNSFQLKYLEKQWSWDRPLIKRPFSNLRHLQLLLSYYLQDEGDKLLYASVSFLRAAPFIEKLEIHFRGGSNLWFAQGRPSRKDLGQCTCKYNHLKNVWISGFKASTGQLEFLLHVIENADALEVLRVEIGQYSRRCFRRYGGDEAPVEEAKQIARTIISTVLPQHVTFDIV